MEQTAKKTGKTYEMDMCNGPLFPKIVAFAVPLILSGILQLLFNAADIIVVGHFAGRESLAAVGSTTALINLMINVFVGLSIGANVLVAQYSGAQKWKDLEETDPYGHDDRAGRGHSSDLCGCVLFRSDVEPDGNAVMCCRWRHCT